jgi:hypothetical protein
LISGTPVEPSGVGGVENVADQFTEGKSNGHYVPDLGRSCRSLARREFSTIVENRKAGSGLQPVFAKMSGTTRHGDTNQRCSRA